MTACIGNPRRLLILFVFCLLSVSGGWSAAAQDPESADAAKTQNEELFVHRVLPLLRERCNTCHGDEAEDIRGNLNTRSRAGLLQGGDSGEPSVIPENAADSPLLLAVLRDSEFYSAMPPKDNDALTADQVQDLRNWIDGGATWPTEARIAELRQSSADRWNDESGIAMPTSGGLSADWTNRRYDPENLWAYQPLWNDPEGQLQQSDQHPIDVLIQDRQRELQVTAAPRADRRTLIRRATYDLIGLPPTPAEVDAFVQDPASDQAAFAQVVDRLLASPYYGEHWGQHWLDVVRYADSSGFANDYERGNAWRYRDYVVRAFNNDKPYDQFVREQIAGDELAQQLSDADSERRSELLIAAGFLRMGPWELTGMEVAKVARQRFLDDVTDAVGQVFLGHMLQCCRCHDHKFDPVPTQDYYGFQANFATTQLAEREAEFLSVENTEFHDEVRFLKQREQYYNQLLEQVSRKQTLDAARQWLQQQQRDPEPFEAAVAELQQQKNKEPDVAAVRRLMQQQDIDPELIPPRHVGFEPQDFGLERIARKGKNRLQWQYERYQPYALSVYSGRTPDLRSVDSPLRVPANRLQNGELEKTHILTGGDPFSPARPVQTSALSVVELTADHPLPAGPDSSELPIEGRRLKLANWIASPDNPLTARVMVNRIWQWHFGQAIAGNPNNFGATGQKPTHPELLDWLAGEFISQGWSVKHMHRLIMTSDAWCRDSTSADPQQLARRDPLGHSYAAFQPRRLTAEELRDAMLFVSGQLNLQVGGIPVRPEMNLEAALQPRMVMGTFAEAWQPSALPEQRHRRSIYALRIRGLRDPFLEVFNAPSPDLSCEAREASTVTPQVFAMFNSEISYDRALALAISATRETESDQAALQRIFRLSYSRPPTEAELQLCLQHWQAMTRRHQNLVFEPVAYPTQVVREAVEENTGEKFRFTEPLEVYEEFVADPKPADADPRTRGLAEVCLVILNSNEFVYVY